MNSFAALIGGALLIAGAWLLLGAALAGVGLVFRRLWLGPEPLDLDEGFTVIWIGYVIVLLVLQSWHFFRPIDTWSLSVIATFGAVGLAVNVRSVRLAIDGLIRPANRVPILTCVVFIIWAANRCTGPLTLYDSGMYHVPAVEWFKAHPIVPGLGNLHGRLAFNPSSLLFAAVIDRGPFASGANHLANGFVLVLVAAEVLRRGTRLLRGIGSRTHRDIMAIVLLPAIMMMFVRQDARSLSTDVVVTGLLMAAGLRLFDSLQYPSLVRPRRAYDLAVLALMVSGAVCVKLNAAPFAAGAVALAAYAALRGSRADAVSLKQLLAAAVMPVLLIGTWLLRGVILSGYPMYPVRLLAAPVDWRVPAEQAGAEAAWVQMSARYLNTNNIGVGLDWLSLWLGDILTRGDLFVHVTLPVFITLGAALGVVLRRRVRQVHPGGLVPGESNPSSSALLFGALLCANAVIWFISAPHTRFIQSTCWLGAGLVVSMRLGPIVNAGAPRSVHARRWLVGATVALIGVLWVGHAAGIARRSQGRISWFSLAQEFLTFPRPGGWLHPMPEPELVTFVTASGLTLHVPKDNSCWNGPLLCTPHPASNLALRRGQDPRSGFVTRGAWEAARFPNPWTPFLVLWRCQQESGAVATRDRDRACLARARGSKAEHGPGS